MEHSGKRVLSLLLALLLVFAAAGCGDQNSNQDTTPGTTQGMTAPEATSDAEQVTTPEDTQGTTAPTDPDDGQDATQPTQTEDTQPDETQPATQPTEVHTHQYGEWTVTTQATCTTDGVKQRVCECGETETQTVPATGHTYVNGICACGAEDVAGTLSVVSGVKMQTYYFSNGSVLVGKFTDGKCYVYSLSGKKLAGPYDYMKACSYDGYTVAWNQAKELTGFTEWGEEIWTTTVIGYVLDSSGKVVYQTEGTYAEYDDGRSYKGEFISQCSDGRIVTYSYQYFSTPEEVHPMILHIYDMSGNKIADIEDVYLNNGFSNGKMLIWGAGSVQTVDRSGNIIGTTSFSGIIDTFSTGANVAGFNNGYMIIQNRWADTDILVSDDLKTVYSLHAPYLYSSTNYGTLVFSKIVEGSSVSDEYYLVDVSKCSTDSDGVVIPTKDAAVCDTPVAKGLFWSYYGQTSKYALISDAEGKWGFMSLDGKTVKMYDDAGYFVNGKAIVKDGDEFYVIDESFKRISNSITGYQSAGTSADGTFAMNKDGVYTAAVYQ